METKVYGITIFYCGKLKIELFWWNVQDLRMLRSKLDFCLQIWEFTGTGEIYTRSVVWMLWNMAPVFQNFFGTKMLEWLIPKLIDMDHTNSTMLDFGTFLAYYMWI